MLEWLKLFLIVTLLCAPSLLPAEAPAPPEKAPGPAKAPKVAKGMRVPPMKTIKDIKQAYESIAAPHILIILHLPPQGGTGYVEAYNNTKQDLAIFQFTLHALGFEGELEFEDLPAGWSAVKEVKLASLLELEVRTPRAYDKDANEISPQLVIHRVDLVGQKLEVGKHKAVK